MKICTYAIRVLVFIFLAVPVFAQSAGDTKALQGPGWNFGVFAGGGSSITVTPRANIFNVGASVGRVMTHEHGHGLTRGTFEIEAEAMPGYVFFSQGRTFYGAAISPLLLKWNFTSGKRVVPYVEMGSSVVFTTDNFPAGDTSRINFATGIEPGVQVYTRPRQALRLGVRALHVSNASIGNHNPGLNAALVFNVGYMWFK